MGKFKRFCMIVFVVAAVLGIGVLAALWFAWEPLFPAIAWLMAMPWFYVVEAVLLGTKTAIGLGLPFSLLMQYVILFFYSAFSLFTLHQMFCTPPARRSAPSPRHLLKK